MYIDTNVTDKKLGKKILQELKLGKRVFGNPAEALMISLKKLDEQYRQELSLKKKTDWNKESELKQDIIKLKAGILGEKTLAEYIEVLCKESDELHGVIFFASLVIGDKELDTDFLAVFGNSVLVLDAKCLRLAKDTVLYVHENKLVSLKAPLFDIAPASFVWENYLKLPVDGIMVIISKSAPIIYKNKEWYKCKSRPIYIGSLLEYLIEWKNKQEQFISLELLSKIAKTQVKKEKPKIRLERFQ